MRQVIAASRATWGQRVLLGGAVHIDQQGPSDSDGEGVSWDL